MLTRKCTKMYVYLPNARTHFSLSLYLTKFGYGNARRTALQRSTVRRTVLTLGNLYTDFTSMEDYFQVRDYAKSLGVLQWESEAKRMLFVTAEGHARVREFIQRRRV